jgi:hypothetical protein
MPTTTEEPDRREPSRSKSWTLPGATLGLVLASPLILAAGKPQALELEESRIYIEYNSTDNDLGFHVLLDGEDWRYLRIFDPTGRQIFHVLGRGAYGELGMTELFFEGAEPALDEVALDELLEQFPEGKYEFVGRTVDKELILGEGELSHAVPAGPDVSDSDDMVVPGNAFVIRWEHVTERATDPAGGTFPDRPIEVVAYQVIVESFQLTLPATGGPMSVVVPAEFIESLENGEHEFEVLAIDASGNQTITAGTFEK